MTNSVIKICNFVQYFFRKGGYLDCDQFSLLLSSLFMGGGRVQREIVPNSLYSLLFFKYFPIAFLYLSFCSFYLIFPEVSHNPTRGPIPLSHLLLKVDLMLNLTILNLWNNGPILGILSSFLPNE